jgi:AcrR family transcriptional regulator
MDCTGQALNARFGSRLGLLLAYSDWSLERNLQRFHEVTATHESPLAALRARFMIPTREREDELTDSGGQLHMLSVILEAYREPEFARRYRSQIKSFEDQVSLLIRASISAGELNVDEPDELAHLLLLSTVGGSALWPMVGGETLIDEVMRIVDSVLAPYLVVRTRS